VTARTRRIVVLVALAGMIAAAVLSPLV